MRRATVVLFLSVCFVIDAWSSCKSGWHRGRNTNKCYRLWRMNWNYYQSHSYCHTQKARLAMMKTPQERDFIRRMVNHIPYYHWQPFLGLTAPAHTCSFRWNDGGHLSSSIAQFTRRDHVGCRINEFCAVINSDMNYEGGNRFLGDCPCHETHRYVLCEMNQQRVSTVKRNKPMPKPKPPKKTTTTTTTTTTTSTTTPPVVCSAGLYYPEFGYCIVTETRWVAGKQKEYDPEFLSLHKCHSLPYRTYFDRSSQTCYVATRDCSAVRYFAPIVYADVSSAVGQELRRRGIPTQRGQYCAYRYSPQCVRGVYLGGHCFWNTDIIETWKDASNDCQNQNGQLFVPHTDADMQILLEYTRTSSDFLQSGMWLGIVEADRWLTVDGSNFDYLRWKPVIIQKSTKSAALFLSKIESSELGSHAGYMNAENMLNSHHGLCVSGTTRQGY